MSGPKIDRVELERRKQAELERKRREQLRIEEERQLLMLKLEAINGKYQRAYQQNASTRRAFSQMPLDAVAQELIRDRAIAQTLNSDEKLRKTQQAFDLPSHGQASNESNQILAKSIARLETELEENMRTVHTIVDQQLEQITKFKRNREMMRKMGEVRYDQVDAMVLVPLALTIPGQLADKANQEQMQRYERLKPYIQATLDSSAYLFYEDRKNFLTAIGDLKKAITEGDTKAVLRAMDWMAANIININNKAGENQSLYARYVALWDQLQTLQNTSVSCPGFGAFASAAALRAACNKLEQEVGSLTQSEYIREQVQEVMREFGYQELTPVVLYQQADRPYLDKSGNNYITLSEDASRAVHVRIGQNGFLMMEVAAAAPNAREVLENGQPMLSRAEEATTMQAAVAHQQSFCDQRPCMIAALKERGVLCGEHTYNAVDPKFAVCLHDSKQPAVVASQEHRAIEGLREAAIDTSRR